MSFFFCFDYFQLGNQANNLIVFVVPFVELFWSLGFLFITCEIAGNSFKKRVSHKHKIFSVFFVLVCGVCYINYNQNFSYATGRMSMEFDDVDAIIGQFKWYLFPLEVQKLLPTLMISAQQEVGFEYFGSKMCNRETFQKV